jgi:dTDP-4-dehydrorhamnose reductase
MKVLVTGGSGFVGRYLVKQMKDIGWDVVAPDKSTLDVTNPASFEIYRGQYFNAVIH